MKDLDHLKLPRAGETSSRFTKEQALAAQKFHQTLPGYSVTRLVEPVSYTHLTLPTN